MTNLEKRGQLLEQVGRNADDLEGGARDFRDMVKAQKEALKAKQGRWGLF
jgi:hypothetical protein